MFDKPPEPIKKITAAEKLRERKAVQAVADILGYTFVQIYRSDRAEYYNEVVGRLFELRDHIDDVEKESGNRIDRKPRNEDGHLGISNRKFQELFDAAVGAHILNLDDLKMFYPPLPEK